MSRLYKMNAYPNNNSKANVSKLILLLFLSVQAIRQLVQVNGQASSGIESMSGKVASWMTITMTLVAATALYMPKTPQIAALGALFVAAMASGIAMIYDYFDATSKQKVEGKTNRMIFGVAHIILALAVLVYLIMSKM
jgi:hypothetical protein